MVLRTIDHEKIVGDYASDAINAQMRPPWLIDGVSEPPGQQVELTRKKTPPPLDRVDNIRTEPPSSGNLKCRFTAAIADPGQFLGHANLQE